MSPDPFLTGVSSRSLLRALLEASPVESEAADTLDHGKDAVYDQKKQKIYIRRMLEPDDFFRAAAVSIAEAQLAEQGGSSQEELEIKSKGGSIHALREIRDRSGESQSEDAGGNCSDGDQRDKSRAFRDQKDFHKYR